MERFNREAIHASDLTDDIHIMVFMKALLPNSRLIFKLSRKNATSVGEIYTIAHEHMVAQELLSQRRTDFTRTSEQRIELRKEHIPRQKNPEPRARNQRDFQKPISFTSRGYKLSVLKRDGNVSWSRAIPKGAKRDKSKYCQFHRDKGYDSEQFYS